ncbi:hypothetical protein B005_3143 [Nocardiopsis alba ATCC BAA-2165]|uniref:Uncharacterized protein n=1 Tax=Nocardiopsis alba (strain ATCC BAA-2165 / BE74) TaxID=1205910 RepID=J7LJJ3_NOCAA|nr:hypothetical protein B005_3143 [Nocardiopsis alba ATCC BAA-2165]
MYRRGRRFVPSNIPNRVPNVLLLVLCIPARPSPAHLVER